MPPPHAAGQPPLEIAVRPAAIRWSASANTRCTDPFAPGRQRYASERYASERYASAADCTTSAPPSASTVTSEPSVMSPSSSAMASRSATWRWMTRLSGRAP